MARSGKTVRFTQVVERAGQPHVHTLWVAPEKDPELKRAQQNHRVMTIEPGGSGGKTDVGVVGFDASHRKNGQFLIFPKSLAPFDGARVVGIKFDLVEQPKFTAPGDLKAITTAKSSRRRRIKHTARPSPVPSATQRNATSASDNVISFPKSAPKTKSRRAKSTPARSKSIRSTASAHHGNEPELVCEVRAALKELKAGRAVVAYQRLERAIANR